MWVERFKPHPAPWAKQNPVQTVKLKGVIQPSESTPRSAHTRPVYPCKGGHSLAMVLDERTFFLDSVHEVHHRITLSSRKPDHPPLPARKGGSDADCCGNGAYRALSLALLIQLLVLRVYRWL